MPETLDYDKIIRTNRHGPNYFRALAILACVLLVLTLGCYFISPNQTKTYGKVLAEAEPQLTKEEKELLFRNACKEVWNRDEETYIVCCEESGKLYRCDKRKKFEPGQFLVVMTDFRKINSFDPYFVCVKSDLYKVPTRCSQKFEGNRGHVVVFGDVPDKKTFKLIELFFYPDGNYSEGELLSYVDKSAPDLELIGSI
ncbi:MAG: hypothetical protein J7J92_03310 [Candidatus Aenigmarchaeota archaeon]|nr:hypothetical protein [Candidatus Aenigmarchaeota archaeon]